MNVRGRLWAVIGCAGGLLWASSSASASAPSRTNVAVLPVVVEGELDDEVRAQINERVREALEGKGYTLVPSVAPGGKCTEHTCIHDVAESADARFVVIPAVGTTSHDYGIAVRLYDYGGALAATRETTCEICSYDEAVSAFGDQSTQLAETLARLVENPYGDRAPESREETGPAELWVQTLPTGAEVRADGTLLGTTPLRIEVEAGLRKLEISKQGYLSLSQTVRTRLGETTEVRLQLAESRDAQNRAMKVSAIVLGTIAVPALAAGITLLVLDERPYRDACEGENLDYEGRCRYQYDTLIGGAVGTAVGVGSVLTAATLGMVLYGRRRAERAEQVEPLVGLRSVGLRVRF